MSTVYLALGSNVGDAHKHIFEAIDALAASINDLRWAAIYESKAVGYTDQSNFLNTVISGESSLEPLALLSFIKQVEQQVGRIARFRWGPREIDIDIIFFDSLVQVNDILTIPHARFAERDFVLRPLCDLNPLLVDPQTSQTVLALLQALPSEQLSIVRTIDPRV